MADNGKTVTVTDGNFGDEIEKHSGLVLVDFWASWCGPCRMVAPVVEQLANEYESKLKVGKLDVDANQQTASRFNIRSIPSIAMHRLVAVLSLVSIIAVTSSRMVKVTGPLSRRAPRWPLPATLS